MERLDLNRLSIWTGVFCTYYRELRTIEYTYYREMTVFHNDQVSLTQTFDLRQYLTVDIAVILLLLFRCHDSRSSVDNVWPCVPSRGMFVFTVGVPRQRLHHVTLSFDEEESVLKKETTTKNKSKYKTRKSREHSFFVS